ncbi:Domain of uncharacterised function (DUF2024) [Serratia liquefaciens]|jgi:hypothetical protein|uniref:DUF2024 family protein n=1 Tax=Serratia liquefaciens TaxID=614 RepID=UPI00217B7E5F|nr:DUF2024 family protein [Serratia liquefaciens]CAI0810540.1 Domain of uncharacterised function (DUF2024) [Serratia liquefaciens]CAI0814390.1 Domain of uncharacterised function (DUF2024) [Serratia liquefaciens]
MYINVFDTHVHTRDGRYLHFDVFTDSNDLAQARHYAQQFLKQNNIEEDNISQSSCAFCHSESSSPEVEQARAITFLKCRVARGCHDSLPADRLRIA